MNKGLRPRGCLVILCQQSFPPRCCPRDVPASCPPPAGTTGVLPAGTPGQHPPCHPAKQHTQPPRSPHHHGQAAFIAVALGMGSPPPQIFTCKEEPWVSELWRRLLKSPLSIYSGGIFPTSGFPASGRVGPHGVWGGCASPWDASLAALSWGDGGPVTWLWGIWGRQLPGMEDGHSRCVGADPCSRSRGPPAVQSWDRIVQESAWLGPPES